MTIKVGNKVKFVKNLHEGFTSNVELDDVGIVEDVNHDCDLPIFVLIGKEYFCFLEEELEVINND